MLVQSSFPDRRFIRLLTKDFFRRAVIDWFAVLLSAVALLALLRWKIGVVAVIIGGGMVGLLYKMIVG